MDKHKTGLIINCMTFESHPRILTANVTNPSPRARGARLKRILRISLVRGGVEANVEATVVDMRYLRYSRTNPDLRIIDF